MMRGGWKTAGSKWTERILRLLYPHICPLCGKVTENEICGSCREKLTYIREPRCMRCGKPVRREGQEYCYDCERQRHIYERGYALWIHNGSVRHSIYQFKYHNQRIFGRFFAEQLYSRYGEAVRRWKIAVIIPIPLSRRKRRIRGYNQAEILAMEFGRLAGIPVEARRLVRSRDTRPQKLMDAHGRKTNVKHAFAWRGKRIRGNVNVLLIDDIYTTGNTIDSAAGELKRAGAGKVYFLTISIGQGY